ncbi:MAG: molecular chaperone TorD family protein [Proteobacteria bacterium]|nr:molecular chaperone TorD family protein [Pseudomonadota bacterium]
MTEQTNTDVDSATAHVRSLAYGYLAKGFQKPEEENFDPNKELFISSWRALIECLEDEEKFRPVIARLEESLRDHTYWSLYGQYEYLFDPQGGIKVSPYETEHTKETPQHAFCQSYEFADIAGFYKAHGLEVSENNPERVDHIATELEFMQVLASKEVMALNNDEKEHISIVRDTQNKFIQDHLGRWAGAFKEKLCKVDQRGFYSNLGELLDKWVDFDRQF